MLTNAAMQLLLNMQQLLMVVVESLTLLICKATILRNYISLLQMIGPSLSFMNSLLKILIIITSL